MESVDSVIEYLKNIQGNLIGILIPTIITASISVITLIVNSIIQYRINDRQYKSKQYEIMREHYPYLKAKLIDIQSCFENIEHNQLYQSDFLITEYIGYDWETYRQNLSIEDIQLVDDFEENIKIAIEVLIVLNQFFDQKNLPTSSRKVQHAINDFQLFCAIFDTKKRGVHAKPSKNYTKEQIVKLIKTLDNHYNKF